MRLKIAIISYASPYYGRGFSSGFERVVGNVVKELDRMGEEIHIFSNKPPSFICRHIFTAKGRNMQEPPPHRARLYPVKSTNVQVLSSHLASFNIFVRKYNSLLKHMDVIQSFQEASYIPFRAPSKRRPLIVSYFVHDEPIKFTFRSLRTELSHELLKFIQYRKSHIVLVDLVAASPELSDFMTKYRLTENRVRVIWEGVDTDLFSPEFNCESIKSQYDGPIVLYAGALEPRKGVDVLVKAAPLVLDHIPDARFVIIGEGTGRVKIELQRLVEELGLKNSFYFKGYVDESELIRYYSAANLFVYPIRTGEFPLPVLEAMACGTPVVGSSTSWIKEIIGDCGLVCLPDSSEMLANRIVKMLSLKSLKNSFGQKCRDRVMHRYNWHSVASRLLEVYEEIV